MKTKKSDTDKTKAQLIEELTELRKQVAQLEASEKQYKAILETQAEGVAIVDPQEKFIFTNPAAEKIFGVEAHDLLGRNLEEFLEPGTFQTVKQQTEKRLKGMQSIYEHEILRPDGEKRIILLTAVPFYDEHKQFKGALSIFRDITERKRAEAENKKLENQLLHAQKMEAIGALAGGIAHDFNNILGAIMGYTELAADDTPIDSPAGKNLDLVLKASLRAKELVKQILTFSRKDEESRKPLFLAEIIMDSVKLLRASLPATIDIRCHIREPLHPVLANPTQMRQVIMNLCTNAAYAMREKGGILEITLKEMEPDPGLLADKNPDHGLYQVLSVSDTGHGIPAEIIRRIFEPYFTTKKTGEGSGMGLAVVHGIVKGHGGEIIAHSEPGKGSIFNIYFKITGEKRLPLQDTSSTEAIPGGNERIIFIDDEKDLAEIGKRLLVNLGYRVVSTTGSLEALEIFRADPSGFDLVISDQTMPHLTGLQLAGQLKQVRPDLPVILCTGFSESIDEMNFKSQGVSDFLMKPISRKEMARVVRKVLDRK